MPRLDATGRCQADQASPASPRKAADILLFRAKNSSLQVTSYDNEASSRASSPTTDASFMSAHSSATSVTQSVQLHAESNCSNEDIRSDKERWGSDAAFSPMIRMPSIDENIEAIDEKAESMDEDEDGDEDLESEDMLDEDLQDEDNDWSGEDVSLEQLVISAVGGDLEFAASLIPALHKYRTARLRSKVESWQYSAAGETQSSSKESNKSISSGNRQPDDTSSSRKRRRQSEDQGDNHGDGGEDDDDGEGNGQPADHSSSPDGVQPLMLACFFHKCNPIKYSADTDRKYRTCAGPGFKSIHRLKEHLRRSHSPVQCERCYKIFPFTDKTRPQAMEKLAAHRQAEVPCNRGDPSLKEGISDAQWAALDAKPRKAIPNQEAHRTEKWSEMWKVLFPERDVPTPWHEKNMRKDLSGPTEPLTQQVEDFVNIIMVTIDRRARDLVFQDGQLTLESQESLKRILRQACTIWTGWYGQIPKSQTSSSLTSGNNPSSVGDGSSTNITVPPACEPVPHTLIQSSAPSVPTIQGGHSSEMKPSVKRSRPSSRTALVQASKSGSQVNPGLTNMTMGVHRLLPPFQNPMLAALPSCSSAGVPMSVNGYLSVGSEQWQYSVPGAYMEPIGGGPSNVNAYQDHSWAPSDPYQRFPQNFDFYPHSSDFVQGEDMDGDMGDMGEIGDIGDL